MAQKLLTYIAIVLFIIVLIVNQCKKMYLTCDLSVYISKYENSLSLYHSGKKLDYIVLSIGRIHKWYALCNDKVYIVHRFGNRINEYTYFDIPTNEFNYLSKRIDLNYFK